MPPTRRTREFSPYSYNIQYAKPGEGPIQRPRPYVNMAILPEEHLVLAKQGPNWFVYVTNSFNYLLGENCQLVFDKLVSTVKIVSKNVALDDFNMYPLGEVAQHLPFTKFNITSSSGNNYAWASKNEVTINHAWGGYIDCIIIADGKYVIAKRLIADPMTIKFDDDFDFRNFRDIFAIVYPIGEMISSHPKAETSSFDGGSLTKTVMFENLFSSTACVPLVLDKDGYAYKIVNADLMPNRILVATSDIEAYNKQDLINERDEINNRLAQIQSDEFTPTTAVDYMVQTNAEYRALYERYQFVDDKIRTMQGLIETNILKIIEYSFDECGSYMLQFGKDSDAMKWAGNSVTVTHNLDGYVNFVIDGAVDVNSAYGGYEASKPLFDVVFIDKDTIRIDFKTPTYPVCTLRLFKVGEVK